MKKFYIAYDTDVGIKKKTNQDSLLLKGCSEEHGETLLIAICDGMGGMEKGGACQCNGRQGFFRLV